MNALRGFGMRVFDLRRGETFLEGIGDGEEVYVRDDMEETTEEGIENDGEGGEYDPIDDGLGDEFE